MVDFRSVSCTVLEQNTGLVMLLILSMQENLRALNGIERHGVNAQNPEIALSNAREVPLESSG